MVCMLYETELHNKQLSHIDRTNKRNPATTSVLMSRVSNSAYLYMFTLIAQHEERIELSLSPAQNTVAGLSPNLLTLYKQEIYWLDE